MSPKAGERRPEAARFATRAVHAGLEPDPSYGSVIPPIGFQAAAGSPPMPRTSQPFQGKSLSFTVRMNIGELRPAIES